MAEALPEVVPHEVVIDKAVPHEVVPHEVVPQGLVPQEAAAHASTTVGAQTAQRKGWLTLADYGADNLPPLDVLQALWQEEPRTSVIAVASELGVSTSALRRHFRSVGFSRDTAKAKPKAKSKRQGQRSKRRRR